jgi:hypothetical protein
MEKISPMKTRILLSVLILFAIVSHGQEIASVEKPSYTRDFGFNSLFIVNGLFSSQTTPFSVMYKKYKGDNKALRFGLDLSLTVNETDGTTLPNTQYGNNSGGSIYLSIGKEFQHQLAGKWMWYFGTDVAPTFSGSRSEVYSGAEKINSSKSTSYGLSLRPFIGIRYNIYSRLYISTEANASLTYSISKNFAKRYNPEETTLDLTTSTVNLGLNPASGIFIFYRF